MAEERFRSVQRRVPVPNPAVGTDWSRVNDSGMYWVVRGLLATLASDANVANREPNVRARADTDVWFRTPVQVAQINGTTVVYSAFPGAQAGTAASASRLFGWPTDGLLLPPGHTLDVVTTLIQVGDQWSAIFLDLVEAPQLMLERLVPAPYLYAIDTTE